MAQIGLKKDEEDNLSNDEDSVEDPHKKSDLFDNSKDRIKDKSNEPKAKKKVESEDEDEFDLGFDSAKKKAAAQK